MKRLLSILITVLVSFSLASAEEKKQKVYTDSDIEGYQKSYKPMTSKEEGEIKVKELKKWEKQKETDKKLKAQEEEIKKEKEEKDYQLNRLIKAQEETAKALNKQADSAESQWEKDRKHQELINAIKSKKHK
jgi:hypothetical protein